MSTRCEGKTLLLLTLLLGIAAFLSLSPSSVSAPYATSMAAYPMQSMQATAAFNPMQPRRPQFMQPARFQPVFANNKDSELEPSRREVMDGLAFAFAAALANEKAAVAVTPVDLKDDRAAKAKGYDIIYEARDLDLPQNIRDGMTQARASTADAKKRVAESIKRLEGVLSDIKVAYWSDAGNALRRQVGTLRFDLNTLAETKGPSEKKAALALKKQYFADIQSLDLAIREKKMEPALKAYAKAQGELDELLKLVG